MSTETMICENLTVDARGHLNFAGQDTVSLAKEYGTPLYLMDEDRLRHNCRIYTEAFRKNFVPGSLVLYASKANAFKRMLALAGEEGMGLDVVSPGEIYTAVKAGFDMSKVYFHSNNKTDADVAFAMAHGVGCFVAESEEELYAIEAEAKNRGKHQRVLIRVTPGIDCHSYEAVNTGKVDSKFGLAIETGQAEAAVRLALDLPHLEIEGFHCHVGSQVFGEDVFQRSATVMLEFMARIRNTLGYLAPTLNLGGGYGVPYVLSDGTVDIAARIAEVAASIRSDCARLGIREPRIQMEPGRSIVADAGLTLYTVGGLKTIPGYKSYVSIDGGMSDNPRFALYGARYTCLPADKMLEERTLTADLVGRCCESGDVIQEAVPFPASIGRGDLVAVCTTGAYNYSMASNYNRLPRPPIVMLHGGESTVAVRRETLEDLVALDL